MIGQKSDLLSPSKNDISNWNKNASDMSDY